MHAQLAVLLWQIRLSVTLWYCFLMNTFIRQTLSTIWRGMTLVFWALPPLREVVFRFGVYYMAKLPEIKLDDDDDDVTIFQGELPLWGR